MPLLIAKVFQWIVRKLGLLLLIIAILLVASWLKDEWVQHRAAQGALERQESLLDGLHEELKTLDAAVEADQKEWRRRTLAQLRPLWDELDEVNSKIERLDVRFQAARGEYLGLARQAQAARRAANDAKERLETLERETWWWDGVLRPQKLARLETARAKYAVLERTARTAEVARSRASHAAAAVRRRTEPLRTRQSDILKIIDASEDSISPRRPGLVAARDRKQRQVESLATSLEAERTSAETNPRERLLAKIRSFVLPALAILAGLLLMPPLIKAFLYFLVAPLAGRLPPIRILPGTDPPPFEPPPRSDVSAVIDIAPGDELLVQPDYLQSSGQPAIKRTRWFLNPRLPIASLASGMFALTSVRPEGEAPTRVVVSSQRDPFTEIGAIAIPAGAAMVVHPRALAAVLKPAGRATHITRHWRLASLHAWLTLQLRYLVFHGPCRLYLKGWRGVRAESPLPDQPRLINQAATLGFSANLDYRTVRTETFVPYLRGREDLFNDLFAGGPGAFVYEEMPARDARYGVAGRGLEGLTDVILKAFGI